MKNYYKILGVKKNAPEEEIRKHWVKFMRKLHPDQRMEGAMEDERIKEINEAYQVLKHSSTRVEYDLKRTYDQEKRGSYFWKLSMPVSILIVLVILGTVYLKKTQITIQPALVTQDTINQINQKNQIDQINQANQINERNQRNEINQMNQINPIASTTRKPKRSNVHNDNNVLNDLTINTSTHPRIDHTIVSTDQQPERSNVLNGNNDPNDLTIRASTQRRDDPVAVFNQTNQINQINQINQRNQRNQTNQIDASTHPRIDGATHEPIDLAIVSATQQSKRSNVLNDNNDLNVIRTSASTPLIATEDEVRQFFANYTERYTQKDSDGFLSLFSPRAVQNRQDGLEAIQKIYGNFFKQSQEIKYYMDDIKIEIYQNAVEVKARYELVQTLKKRGDKKIWRGDIRWALVKEGGALKILSLDYQPQKSY
jgi:curved DNA-binding protein CbpA